jgi:hypothetical protein
MCRKIGGGSRVHNTRWPHSRPAHVCMGKRSVAIFSPTRAPANPSQEHPESIFPGTEHLPGRLPGTLGRRSPLVPPRAPPGTPAPTFQRQPEHQPSAIPPGPGASSRAARALPGHRRQEHSPRPGCLLGWKSSPVPGEGSPETPPDLPLECHKLGRGSRCRQTNAARGGD